MTRYRLFLWSLLLVTVTAAVAAYATHVPIRDCDAEKLQSAISVRSGELCSQTINCKMDYAQVRSIVAEKLEAEGCK